MTAAAQPRPSAFRSRATRVGIVVACVVMLAMASWAAVPMYPVPMTLQTLALFVIAALAGPRMTIEIVLVWLAAAAMGLPLLAGFQGGIAAFSGPTAGFLLAFIVVAPVLAWAAPKARGGDLFALFLAAHTAVLVMGWAWLAGKVGAPQAAMAVQPFFFGAIVKSAAATILVMLAKARLARALKPK
jgi:biotin transport system substrate-specific component